MYGLCVLGFYHSTICSLNISCSKSSRKFTRSCAKQSMLIRSIYLLSFQTIWYTFGRAVFDYSTAVSRSGDTYTDSSFNADAMLSISPTTKEQRNTFLMPVNAIFVIARATRVLCSLAGRRPERDRSGDNYVHAH